MSNFTALDTTVYGPKTRVRVYVSRHVTNSGNISPSYFLSVEAWGVTTRWFYRTITLPSKKQALSLYNNLVQEFLSIDMSILEEIERVVNIIP